MSDPNAVLHQVQTHLRGLKRCFVCNRMRADTKKISDPRFTTGPRARRMLRGATRRVCVGCLAGRPWSVKATANEADETYQYLRERALLFTLFPPHIARCLQGMHKHPVRLPHACLIDWRVDIQIRPKHWGLDD